jgi:hypothetical protein
MSGSHHAYCSQLDVMVLVGAHCDALVLERDEELHELPLIPC